MEEFAKAVLNGLGITLTTLAVLILMGKAFGMMAQPYTPEAGIIMLGSAFWITCLFVYLRDKTKTSR